ncbi:hypothetical protein ACFQE0_13710 [Methylobacterium komagatae]|uniref:Uncharacterized protein n=1 Tax=Methylobacterium komagatae TaxID=374425 RepID=A0ABW2BK39_9HYPH
MGQAVATLSTPALCAADLDTEVNCEPRILDTVLGAHLGMAQARNIRQLIEGAAPEIATYGEVCTRHVQTSAKGGRPGRAFYLTEGQALCVCALSRAPNAPQVRRALIEAFMELRRQKLASLAAPATVKVREHTRSLPRPAAMKDGRGCIILGGAPVFFDTARRPAVGQPALVMWRTGRISIEPMLEQHPEVPEAFVPGPAFIWVLEPGKALGAYRCRQKVTLLGLVITESGRPAPARLARG